MQTTRTGAANVAAATDDAVRAVIGEWQLANYLAGRDDLAERHGGHAASRYTSWDLPAIFASFSEDDPDRFPRAYPLEPDVFTGSEYSRAGLCGPARATTCSSSSPPGPLWTSA